MGLTKMKSGRKKHIMKIAKSPWSPHKNTPAIVLFPGTHTIQIIKPMTVMEFHNHVCDEIERDWIEAVDPHNEWNILPGTITYLIDSSGDGEIGMRFPWQAFSTENITCGILRTEKNEDGQLCEGYDGWINSY